MGKSYAAKYDVETIAGYVVDKCIKMNRPITNTQLQRMLFFIQKWYLKHGTIAFDADFVAQPCGPICLPAYYKYSGYGAMEIDMPETNTENIDKEDAKIIDEIIEEKLALSPFPFALSKEVCKKGGAWDYIYSSGTGRNNIIPKEMIKKEN